MLHFTENTDDTLDCTLLTFVQVSSSWWSCVVSAAVALGALKEEGSTPAGPVGPQAAGGTRNSEAAGGLESHLPLLDCAALSVSLHRHVLTCKKGPAPHGGSQNEMTWCVPSSGHRAQGKQAMQCA